MLASLVESMAAEAAGLHRQLGALTLSGGGGQGGKGVAGTPAATASSCGAASPMQSSVSVSAAEVERQLAALSSKLGHLTLCLQSMQQSPGVEAERGAEAQAQQQPR